MGGVRFVIRGRAAQHPLQPTGLARSAELFRQTALRSDSTPRLYNLVEIACDHSQIKVYTRCMRKDGGAWEPYAVWTGDAPGERRAYYVLV